MLLESPNKFRRGLMDVAKGIPDLERKIKEIERQVRTRNTWADFYKDPYRKERGEFVYQIVESDESALFGKTVSQNKENWLEVLTPEEIESILSSGEFNLKKRGEIVWPNHLNPSRIILLPDTNISLFEYNKILGNLKKFPEFETDCLTIVAEERKRKGLKRFRNIPPELERGFSSISKRLVGDDEEYLKEIERFYNCILQYFSTTTNSLKELLRKDPSKSNIEIARQVASIPEEIGIYTKYIEKLRMGSSHGLIADRLLVAASYALNLRRSGNITVVISEDSDLKGITRLMHDEIFPRYVADAVYENARGIKGKLKRLIESPEDLIDTAKEHLSKSERRWASEKNSRHSAGIVYNPRTDLFTVSTLPQAYVEFIRGIEEYQSDKTSMIIGTKILGCTPEETLGYLSQRRSLNLEEIFKEFE